eukprot:m.20406 g.20406  ORF g.20406 m.20406 type:complete len:241 (+) comp8873_c0_seq1:72-794(+)
MPGEAENQRQVTQDGDKKIVVERMKDADGSTVEVRTVYKLEKQEIVMPKRVHERRQWRKFGLAEGKPAGPEPATTSLGDIVNIEFIAAQKAEEKKQKQKDVKPGMSVAYKVPARVRMGLPEQTQAAEQRGGKYRPPRAGTAATEQAPTLQINNLPEETKDEDLKELLAPLFLEPQEDVRQLTKRYINRLYLAKDKKTGLSRGFAKVEFSTKEYADKAFNALENHRYGYSILHCEWLEDRK